VFKTLKEAQTWIESVEKFGQKYDLIRMENACNMLGNPQDTFKSVHIGGTNGKGSTLQFLHQILLKAGYNVGTFTSPYIVHFNERITLNGAMIDDESLLHYINEIHVLQETYREKYNDQITFFELLTLISFLYFSHQEVDVVLYEVGLGGTLDATNVITPILSIITSVGYDHMGVLGKTLKSIAINKLGIVKDEVPLINGIKQPHLQPLIKSHCEQKKAPLIDAKTYPATEISLGRPTTFKLEDRPYTINLNGSHQVDNAKLAILAAEELNKRGFSIAENAIKDGLSIAFMPGRFEIIDDIVLDGAHNITGLKESLKTFEAYYPGKQKTVVFTVMADKDYLPMLRLLETVDQVIFTEIPYVRSEKATMLAHKSKHRNFVIEPDYKKALNHVHDKHAVLVTGSLYFISMFRRYMLER